MMLYVGTNDWWLGTRVPCFLPSSKRLVMFHCEIFKHSLYSLKEIFNYFNHYFCLLYVSLFDNPLWFSWMSISDQWSKSKIMRFKARTLMTKIIRYLLPPAIPRKFSKKWKILIKYIIMMQKIDMRKILKYMQQRKRNQSRWQV